MVHREPSGLVVINAHVGVRHRLAVCRKDLGTDKFQSPRVVVVYRKGDRHGGVNRASCRQGCQEVASVGNTVKVIEHDVQICLRKRPPNPADHLPEEPSFNMRNDYGYPPRGPSSQTTDPPQEGTK